MAKELEGIIPALITPFDEFGHIDYDNYQNIVSELSLSGVNGFFVSGTTGEGPYQLTEEKVKLAELTKSASGGRQYICAAAIKPSTYQVLKEIEQLSKAEPDYLVVVPPFYFKHDQQTVVDHYKEIVAETDIPIIAYDIPQHTHTEIEYETRMELVKMSGIVGLKDSTGVFSQFTKALVDEGYGGFKWIQGWDNMYAPSAFLGAHGYVSGLSHLEPETFVELYKAAKASDHAAVIEKQKRINKLYELVIAANGKVIPAIKFTMSLMKKSAPYLRQIKNPLTDAEIDKLTSKMKELSLK